MIGFFVAGAVVALLQYLRLRDRRVLPILAFFALEALSLSFEEWQRQRSLFHLGAGTAVLVLLVMLAPRHGHRTPPPAASRPEEPR